MLYQKLADLTVATVSLWILNELNEDLGRIEGKNCVIYAITVEGCCRSLANALNTCAVRGQANKISNKTIHCPSSWIICTRPDQWRIVF